MSGAEIAAVIGAAVGMVTGIGGVISAARSQRHTASMDLRKADQQSVVTLQGVVDVLRDEVERCHRDRDEEREQNRAERAECDARISALEAQVAGITGR